MRDRAAAGAERDDVEALQRDALAAHLAAAAERGLELMTTGRAGDSLKLTDVRERGLSRVLAVRINLPERRVQEDVTIQFPLIGAFQIENALVAAGLAIAAGLAPESALRALEGLRGARGRLDLAGTTATGAPIFVDYAHTPDALANALRALRPYARGRLVVVFGAGGDRDRGKRPLMGAAATELADVVIVTDDNPRSEEAAAIRREILAAAPGAREIGDRAEAIRTAVRELRAGDVLLVAGKGHETGQIVGSRVLPFSDHDAVAAALEDALHV
jgi:UDP-N-acetylmuramoyl-L-alanyl-D-glutamate--2,6-diaminopimelate ligase